MQEVLYMKVAIIMGSKSDIEVMKKAAEVLKSFDISYSAYIISAHRALELLQKTILKLEEENCQCIIAGAGLAAHLPGVIAAMTTIPVIGVPLESKLDGMDALLSIVQMPYPIPVATVGVDNSKNAAMLAVTMLSIKYEDLKIKLKRFREDMKEELKKDLEKGVDL